MRSSGTITALSKSPKHEFSKTNVAEITLIEGIGVDGDAHAGKRVKHRSRVVKDPTQANLRQVHLIHAELHDELMAKGFAVKPGDIGENITTRGVELLNLPKGTQLLLGSEAVVEITGLRNPCKQIEAFQTGLLKANLGRTEDGVLIRKSGVMSIVLKGGPVKVNDRIEIVLPKKPYQPLEVV